MAGEQITIEIQKEEKSHNKQTEQKLKGKKKQQKHATVCVQYLIFYCFMNFCFTEHYSSQSSL